MLVCCEQTLEKIKPKAVNAMKSLRQSTVKVMEGMRIVKNELDTFHAHVLSISR